MDEAFVNKLVFLLGIPAWGGLLIYAMRTAKVWPELAARFNERFRDRAQISSGDWRNLREQIEWLTNEVKECRKSEGEWMQRAMKAEAQLMGVGEVRAAAANAAAEIRADPAKAPTTIKRFGGDNGESGK